MDTRENKRIDEWLDAALKGYGVAEPRPGLENRIFANVRAERRRATVRGWRRWPAVAAMAAVLLISVGVFLARSRGNAKSVPIAKENVGAEAKPNQRDYPGAEQGAHDVHRVNRSAPRHGTETAAHPRTEQFPTPQPLSEQEIALERYIEEFPREATLMAQAQTELTRQEMLDWSQPENQISDSELQNQ